jgi:hypothetical protein
LYTPVATGLFGYPATVAIDLIVVVTEMVIGPVYTVELVVGVDPSVV